MKHDNNVEKTLSILKLKDVPKTGLENYTDLKVLWKKNNWTSVRDLLIMYNNLGVLPFVEALLKILPPLAKSAQLCLRCVTQET